ncbi:MAG: hypothetical protein ABJC04_13280, partial [Verrucomicrobiota bacterium]
HHALFLRIGATSTEDQEYNTAKLDLNNHLAELKAVTNELEALEVKLAPTIADLNRRRDEAIAKAKADLVTYDDMTKNLRVELERRRQSEFAATERELKDYEKLLPAQAAFWETKNNPADTKTTWILADTTNISATSENKLVRQKDGSLTASGGGITSDYVLVVQSPLTNITGVMLEALPDENLPKFGPGRSPDGNFVLSELELNWASGTNTPATAAKFVDARADFSQTSYPVTEAIDGKVEAGKNGWAIGGSVVQRHTATFKLGAPIASTNGATLRFTLKQQHAGAAYLLGRFRLYVTMDADPLDFGVPEIVVQAARAPAGQRQSKQASAILDFYRNTDAEFWKRKQAAVNAAAPLPVDPKLTELQQAATNAEKPIHLDPALVQLRVDAQASGKQSENKRLTVVQDLTWALINSPGFLFNH